MRSTFQSTYKASLGGVSDMSKLKSLAVHGKNKRPVCSDLGEMPGMALMSAMDSRKEGNRGALLPRKHSWRDGNERGGRDREGAGSRRSFASVWMPY